MSQVGFVEVDFLQVLSLPVINPHLIPNEVDIFPMDNWKQMTVLLISNFHAILRQADTNVHTHDVLLQFPLYKTYSRGLGWAGAMVEDTCI